MRIYNPEQTAQALPYHALVPAIEYAALQLSRCQIDAPERQIVPVGPSGVLLTMPAVAADIGVTKLITVHRGNAQHRLPVIQGEVIVFCAETGRRLALLDGPTLTARRTAAVTLAGIRALAPAAPSSAVLIGTGVQAAAHMEALADFLGVARFWVAGRDIARARQFCEAGMQRTPQAIAMPIGPEELQARCQEADIVIAMTTATAPVIPDALRPSTMAIGIGAFRPDMAELPASLLQARRIVVDHLAGARHEAGDLLRAGIDWDAVLDLPTLIAGGGIDRNGVAPVFKTVGHAAWDLAAARVALACG